MFLDICLTHCARKLNWWIKKSLFFGLHCLYETVSGYKPSFVPRPSTLDHLSWSSLMHVILFDGDDTISRIKGIIILGFSQLLLRYLGVMDLSVCLSACLPFSLMIMYAVMEKWEKTQTMILQQVKILFWICGHVGWLTGWPNRIWNYRGSMRRTIVSNKRAEAAGHYCWTVPRYTIILALPAYCIYPHISTPPRQWLLFYGDTQQTKNNII